MAEQKTPGQIAESFARFFDSAADRLEECAKLSTLEPGDSYYYGPAALPKESIDSVLAAIKTVTGSNASFSKFLGDMATYGAVLRLVHKQYKAKAEKLLAQEADAVPVAAE